MNYNVQNWIDLVKNGGIIACKEQHLLVKYVENCFKNEDIYVDEELLENYLRIVKYFPYKEIFPWQLFCLTLHLCTFWRDTGLPRFPDLLLLIGRGAGKDGYIALESMTLVSPYNKIKEYDVDICANAEEQAMRPMLDAATVITDSQNFKKLSNFYKVTAKSVTGKHNKGVIKGRTNNPKSKDGMRSGMVVFNEIHQYLNFDNIKVFVTGLGKKAHPRRLYATTNGDVRDALLDKMIDDSLDILNGIVPDNGLLPFLCRLDDKKEAKNEEMWVKANPSLPYLPDLFNTIKKEFNEWKKNKESNSDFMTKRMNLPQSANDVAVTDYANIKATNRAIPDLTGWTCVCGIDYASLNDFASVNLRFKGDGVKYDISHTWVHKGSKDIDRIKVNLGDWEKMGLLTFVDKDEPEISPFLIAEWIDKQKEKYYIKSVAIDDFRLSLIASALFDIGYDIKYRQNLKIIKPVNSMKVLPVIESDFNNQRLVWGDNPLLRWAANNTKVVVSGKRQGTDTGNRFFAKIESKSRKTDPFMAMVAAACIEDELPEYTSADSILNMKPIVW